MFIIATDFLESISVAKVVVVVVVDEIVVDVISR